MSEVYCWNCKHYRMGNSYRPDELCLKAQMPMTFKNTYLRRVYDPAPTPAQKNASNDCPDHEEGHNG